MSDPTHDPMAPDPVDKAYREAEAVLNGEEARKARRARVLAAIAADPGEAAEPEPAVSSRRKVIWRRGGWLAAACIAGFGLIVATQVWRPATRPPPPSSAPAERVAPAPEPLPPGIVSAPLPTARNLPPSQPAAPPARRGAPEAARADADALNLAEAPPPAPPPPPPPPATAPAPAASPAPPSPQQNRLARESRSSAAAEDVMVTGARIQQQGAVSAFAPPRAAKAAEPPAAQLEAEAKLRRAAAAGRTAEVAELLEQGARVDATDREGETALMKAVRAKQAAAAALLRRKGASLDLRNRAGFSARELAEQADDAALDKALGFGP